MAEDLNITPEQVREQRFFFEVAFDEPERSAALRLCDSWLLQQKVVDAAMKVYLSPGGSELERLTWRRFASALAALSPAASPDEGETT